MSNKLNKNKENIFSELIGLLEGVRDSSLSRNNAENLAGELLQAISDIPQDVAVTNNGVMFGIHEKEHLAEEYECAMMWLDDIKAPRCHTSGIELSMVGRVMCAMNMPPPGPYGDALAAVNAVKWNNEWVKIMENKDGKGSTQ